MRVQRRRLLVGLVMAVVLVVLVVISFAGGGIRGSRFGFWNRCDTEIEADSNTFGVEGDLVWVVVGPGEHVESRSIPEGDDRFWVWVRVAGSDETPVPIEVATAALVSATAPGADYDLEYVVEGARCPRAP